MLINNKFFKKIVTLSLFALFGSCIAINLTANLIADSKVSYNIINTTDKNTKKISIHIDLEKDDFVYKDYIKVSADHPQIELSEWRVNTQSTNHFSKEFKETKKIFNKNFVITLNAKQKSDKEIKDAHIHLSYYLNSKKGIVERTIPFNLESAHEEMHDIETSIETDVITEKAVNNKNNKKKEKKKSWTQYLEDLAKTTDSMWVRLLLSVLLGFLLSLTPCIYPMIPITIGILQAQGSKSVAYNFFLSFVYVMGMSVTFATLGLIAAFTGQIFSSILANPIFVSIMVAFLTYLALSMLGFYDMYIPKFMKQSGDSPTKKSILSIFMFGVVSGSIASPCVSPGLVLLLSIVTTIGSKLLGFLLLFAFGIGLGLPLILIGTFSGSINKLPKAGMWMLEIKKLFGLLLFGVCFYFMNNIMPWHILLWIMSGFMLVMGIFYLYSIKAYDSKFWKFFKNIVGIACCVLSVLIAFNAYKETYLIKPTKEIKFWKKDYDTAIKQAKAENKKVFIDLWTQVCALCKAIDKKVFTDQNVLDELNKKFVNIKVDGTDLSKEPFASLQKKYKIVNFPTFLLIDPNTGDVIKRWSSEFYNMSNQDIIDLIKSL